MEVPRLDLLIYAHDGRGLGHASRSIAVGMAVRRLFPDMKVLFLSGCRESAELIGNAPLDWIKLPSYESMVVDGKSTGKEGFSNFSSKEMGIIRGELIRSIVRVNDPRCVLVDHSPQGKRRELLPALTQGGSGRTKWVLGMRAVIGDVNSVWSDTALSAFKAHYHGILWYGDSKILGDKPLRSIHRHYGFPPVEVGYVSRLQEIVRFDRSLTDAAEGEIAGTVSVPWMGENTAYLLLEIAKTLKMLGERYGEWHLYLGSRVLRETGSEVKEALESLPFCILREVGPRYFRSLLNSRVSLIYGGYNSMTDVLAAQKPSVVVVRGMQDREQEDHVAKLAKQAGNLVFLEEKEADSRRLFQELEAMLESPPPARGRVNLDGAENTARYIATLL
ncbi:MAG: hypothetical protein JRJ03_09015 [Deltaproteobacteria bacterium]|nr:hypothetical protein [Deltaproteobacteria bacterium]